MWENAYDKTPMYLGIDADPNLPTNGREMKFGLAEDVLPSIDFKKFNVFDLDAFADPWKEFDFIAQRIKPNGQVFFLTESLGRSSVGKPNKSLPAEILPWGSRVFKRDRVSTFRTAVRIVLNRYGLEPEGFKIFQKMRQPRTIYAGFRVKKYDPKPEIGSEYAV
jgi:hypothetical protein